MVTYGIKVSKPGYDVKVAADQNLLLTTELPNYKIAASGTFQLVTNGSGFGTTTINHSLGYAPNNFIQIQHEPAGNYRRLNTFVILTDYIMYTSIIGTSGIEIRSIPTGAGANSQTFNGYYYVYYDPTGA